MYLALRNSHVVLALLSLLQISQYSGILFLRLSVVNISDIMVEMCSVSTIDTASFQEFKQCG